jgi:CheY-like chemotaxis protein
MAITKHIVELHGGTIRAESPGEGQGATFVLKLPIMIMHQTGPLRPETEQKLSPTEKLTELVNLAGVHVLVVEDERDARDLLTTVLRQSGAEVTSVANVTDALEQLQRIKPDLLVSDIEMPDEDGYSLIRKVRALAEAPRIPAIALTAHARPADRLRALSAGYQMHIPKPAEPAELVMAIANLINREPVVSANDSFNPTTP